MEEKYKILKTETDRLLAKKETVIIAIDGCCGAGKTTLADKLSKAYDCNVFHMDDFFLRPEQRTEERLGEVGGNVDYERFHHEVIMMILSGKDFSYQPYDCQTGALKEPIHISRKALNIVEGSYSLHPYNRFAYDFKVFMSINEKVQRERILKRSPMLHEKFFNMWIPMEEKYFSQLKSQCKFDLIFE